MNNFKEMMLVIGFFVAFLSVVWFFILQPQMQEHAEISRIRSTATLQGRSANAAEAEYREIKKAIHDHAMQ